MAMTPVGPGTVAVAGVPPEAFTSSDSMAYSVLCSKSGTWATMGATCALALGVYDTSIGEGLDKG